MYKKYVTKSRCNNQRQWGIKNRIEKINNREGNYLLEGNSNLQKGNKLNLHKKHDQYGKLNHFLTCEKHLQPGIRQFLCSSGWVLVNRMKLKNSIITQKVVDRQRMMKFL